MLHLNVCRLKNEPSDGNPVFWSSQGRISDYFRFSVIVIPPDYDYD